MGDVNGRSEGDPGEIGAVFAVLPSGPFQASSQQIGVALFEEYVFPFEMVSILLLAAIVGALLLSGRAKAAEVSS